MAGGRPKYNWTPEIEDEILCRITHGESLRAISEDESIPASSTIYQHLIESKEFAEKYAHAREAQMEAMADEILAIADDTTHDTMTVKNVKVADNEWINRSRLRVDTRKWLMSKLACKKYGDKLVHTGADGAGPIQAEVTVNFVKTGETKPVV